ncbi:MAG: DNA mismatch repair endonuclease MutL [Gammaproteobacteria bacterium]|nr:DNA mismatch repair endonuclease MutL [Gammaproteobacteria bacterium]
MSEATVAPRRTIRALSTHLANQIAAGEVVERPASVVKELVENSLDAKASHIEVALEAGGTRLIRVADNGSGIAAAELAAALAPHATSKIYSQQELESITTLGFRGEALASIAAVAAVTLSSREPTDDHGWQLSPQGELLPVALPVGTVIEVRELFYNIPARKRFLRSERTEFLQVEEVLRRLALSHFEVAWLFSHNGRELLRLPAIGECTTAAQQVRVEKFFGKAFTDVALTIADQQAGMQLRGWVSPVTFTLPHRERQYFFLNGRMIKDRLITHAVRTAWHELLESGRHAAWLLYLEIDPRQVDVNVHPTKHEVRFREGRMVHDFIVTTLRQQLLKGESTTIATPREAADATTVTEPATAAYFRRYGQTSAGRSSSGGRQERSQWALAAALRATPETPQITSAVTPAVQASEAPAAQEHYTLLLHTPLFERFLLIAWQQQCWLFDLQGWWQQALASQLRSYLSEPHFSGKAKPLLMPVTLRLNQEEIAVTLPFLASWQRLGITVVQQGEDRLQLQQLPLPLAGVDAMALLQLLVALAQSQACPPERAAQWLPEKIAEVLQLPVLPAQSAVLQQFWQRYGVAGLSDLVSTPYLRALTPDNLLGLLL